MRIYVTFDTASNQVLQATTSASDVAELASYRNAGGAVLEVWENGRCISRDYDKEGEHE